MATVTHPVAPSTGARFVDWILRLVLALAFAAAGGAKLAAAPPMVAIFEQSASTSGSDC